MKTTDFESQIWAQIAVLKAQMEDKSNRIYELEQKVKVLDSLIDDLCCSFEADQRNN